MSFLKKVLVPVIVLFAMVVGVQIIAPITNQYPAANLFVGLAFLLWILWVAMVVFDNTQVIGPVVVAEKPVVREHYTYQNGRPEVWHEQTVETTIHYGFTAEEVMEMMARQQEYNYAVATQAMEYMHKGHIAAIGAVERMVTARDAKQQELIGQLFDKLDETHRKLVITMLNRDAKLLLEPVEQPTGAYYEIEVEPGLYFHAIADDKAKNRKVGLTPQQVQLWTAIEQGEPLALPAPRK